MTQTTELLDEQVDTQVDAMIDEQQPVEGAAQEKTPSPIMGTIEIVPEHEPVVHATYQDWIAADDRLTLNVRHPAWTYGGKPITLRVQSLSLEEQEHILREARIAASEIAAQTKEKNPPAQDWQTYCIETMRTGVIMPKLSKGQAKLLAGKSAKAVEDLVNWIWGSSNISRAFIESMVNANTPDPDAVTD